MISWTPPGQVDHNMSFLYNFKADHPIWRHLTCRPPPFLQVTPNHPPAHKPSPHLTSSRSVPHPQRHAKTKNTPPPSPVSIPAACLFPNTPHELLTTIAHPLEQLTQPANPPLLLRLEFLSLEQLGNLSSNCANHFLLLSAHKECPCNGWLAEEVGSAATK